VSNVVPILKEGRKLQAYENEMFGFDPRSGHVGSVVDKVALGQVFSEYFRFPC
jgi:hypothetical protein